MQRSILQVHNQKKILGKQMNKKEWTTQKGILVKHLETAQKNLKTATDQIAELELTIGAYDQKIKTFK